MSCLRVFSFLSLIYGLMRLSPHIRPHRANVPPAMCGLPERHWFFFFDFFEIFFRPFPMRYWSGRVPICWARLCWMITYHYDIQRNLIKRKEFKLNLCGFAVWHGAFDKTKLSFRDSWTSRNFSVLSNIRTASRIYSTWPKLCTWFSLQIICLLFFSKLLFFKKI